MNPWSSLVRTPAQPTSYAATPRSYIACKLLEHGALDFPEFREITGWKSAQAAQTLHYLSQCGVVVKKRVLGVRRYIYELADE